MITIRCGGCFKKRIGGVLKSRVLNGWLLCWLCEKIAVEDVDPPWYRDYPIWKGYLQAQTEISEEYTYIMLRKHGHEAKKLITCTWLTLQADAVCAVLQQGLSGRDLGKDSITAAGSNVYAPAATDEDRMGVWWSSCVTICSNWGHNLSTEPVLPSWYVVT